MSVEHERAPLLLATSLQSMDAPAMLPRPSLSPAAPAIPEEGPTSPGAVSPRSPGSPGSPGRIAGSMPAGGTFGAGVESLDFEIYENALYRAEQASRGLNDQAIYVTIKWGVCLVLATLLAFAAFAVNLGTENLSAIKFRSASALLKASPSALPALFVYTLFNLTLVLMASVATVYYAPGAAGSGIPEVKAFLNGVDVPGLMLLRSLVAKIFGITLVVSAGLPLGKEGPFVHIGAMLASLLTDGGSARHRVGWRAFRALRNDRDRRDNVLAGSAAGVAGAFRSPIGGLLFALEELATSWRPHLLWRAFFTCAVVVFLSRSLARLCGGGACGFASRGVFVVYEIQNGQEEFYFRELIPLVVIGTLGGMLGAAFIRCNELINRWRRDVAIPRFGPLGRVAEALTASLVISLITFALAMAGRCRACPSSLPGTDNPIICPTESGRYVQMQCPPGYYSDLGTLIFNEQDQAIRNLFAGSSPGLISFSSLILYTAWYFSVFVWTYGMAFPAGSLVPSIVVGAAFGRAVGTLKLAAGAGPIGPGGGGSAAGGGAAAPPSIDEATYALLGSAAMLAGVMRSTASLAVILLEITNNLALLPPVMLVNLVAKFVADLLAVPGLFENHLRRVKPLPFLEPNPERTFRNYTAADVASLDLVSLPRTVQVAELIRVLGANSHNAFPVHQPSPPGSAGPGPFLGLVLRSQILHVLATGQCLQKDESFDPEAVRAAYSLDAVSMSKPASTRGIDLCDLNIPPARMSMYLNLAPYVNPAPLVVQADTSLTKAYQLFIRLGLRHLPVIPRADRIVGLLTRKDLHPDTVHSRTLERGVPGTPPELPPSQTGTLSLRLQSLHNRRGGAVEAGGGA